MRRFVFLTVFLCLVFVSGCSGELKPSSVEDVALVNVLGIDYIDDNRMQLTLAVPQPSVVGPTQTYSTESSLIKEGIVAISSQADKEIKLNGLRIVLIDEEFAQSGKLWDVVEHLYRNPVIGGKVLIVVVKESAKDMLEQEYPGKAGIVTYLNDLLKPKPHNMFNPYTSIHDFIYTQTNPVMDTVTPYLELKEEKVEITGVALFKEKRAIGVLNREQGQLIKILQGAKRLPATTITVNEEIQTREQVVVDFVDSDVHFKSNKDINNPVLDITLKLKGTLYEYQGDKDLSNSDDFAQLEKEIRDFMHSEVTALLADLKEKNTDPVGLSENFRKYHHGRWSEELTDKVTQNAEYRVHVKMQVLATGTIR
ncbi:Ger(x)C family spore germination protein [Jeotgalibacillus sp. S-D1]|uniref:Ger(x)C family spore germination protein n=1 Tax=Jeotgalibacillus sp. S-D1 TaxID=2552189 RepID=UPI0014046028|nr:Ger(x)C family spore germination protein [Jeotgalibacillus sp. S-D1]